MAAAALGQPARGRSAAVGPLLAFGDPALEAGFVAQLHARRLPNDHLTLWVMAVLDLVVMLWKLVPRRRWTACALLASEALASAGLVRWLHRRPASYLAHRSAVVAALCVVHALVGRQGGGACGGGCGGPLLCAHRIPCRSPTCRPFPCPIV